MRDRLHWLGLWRRVGVFAVAYLMVVQAALAGVGPSRMQEQAGGQPFSVLCSGAVADVDGQPRPAHAPFDCCGLGCLVGAHFLAGPAGPDETLRRPQPQAFVSPRLTEAPRSPGVERVGPRPRGPPSLA